MLAVQSLLGAGRRSISKPSILAQTRGSQSLSLSSPNRSPLPGSDPSDPRPHVKKGIAPPPGTVSILHRLRLAETRMSTGMRRARGRALCLKRRVRCRAFQREVGRGRRAGARSGLVPVGSARPGVSFVPCESHPGVPAGSEGRMGWTEESRRLHFDVDARLRASVQLCAKNPYFRVYGAILLDLARLYPCTWGRRVFGRAGTKPSWTYYNSLILAIYQQFVSPNLLHLVQPLLTFPRAVNCRLCHSLFMWCPYIHYTITE